MSTSRARIACTAVLLLAGCRGGDRAPMRPLQAGDAVPAFAARTLAEDSIDVREGEGPILLNVWATWCIPCRDEMPALQALHDSLGAAGLRVIGVSVDGAAGLADVRRFLMDYEITFPTVHDPNEHVTRAFRTTGVPETFLISSGRVVRRWIGPITEAAAAQAVAEVLPGGSQDP